MEDQDKRTEEQEDVEAHRRKAMAASEGPSDEAEGDDVEAHARRKLQAQASEDAPEAEEGEDEDFELHRKSPRAL